MSKLDEKIAQAKERLSDIDWEYRDIDWLEQMQADYNKILSDYEEWNENAQKRRAEGKYVLEQAGTAMSKRLQELSTVMEPVKQRRGNARSSTEVYKDLQEAHKQVAELEDQRTKKDRLRPTVLSSEDQELLKKAYQQAEETKKEMDRGFQQVNTNIQTSTEVVVGQL